MKVALYARVSTINGHQDPETQLVALREYCQQRGWTIAEEFVDRGVSGSKVSRPALNRLMTDAKRRRFEAVVVWKLDRFGRSLQHLVNSLAEFNALNVGFVSMTDAMDLTTPQGRMMFGIISVMAEFERGLIQERVKAGMRAAKAKGHLPGRKRQKLDLDAIRSRIAAGESLRGVAGTLNVSPALLSKRLKGM